MPNQKYNQQGGRVVNNESDFLVLFNDYLKLDQKLPPAIPNAKDFKQEANHKIKFGVNDEKIYNKKFLELIQEYAVSNMKMFGRDIRILTGSNYVDDGDIVPADTILLELDPTDVKAKIQQLKEQNQSLLLRRARLEAEANMEESFRPVGFPASAELKIEELIFKERRAALDTHISDLNRKILQKENVSWFTPEYHNNIQEICKQAYEAEQEVVDWIFENGELDFLPKAVINEFLKNRFNNSLESIGIGKVFEVDQNLVSQTEWFDDEIIGTKHGDFFVKRSINYSKRSQSITSDDLF